MAAARASERAAAALDAAIEAAHAEYARRDAREHLEAELRAAAALRDARGHGGHAAVPQSYAAVPGGPQHQPQQQQQQQTQTQQTHARSAAAAAASTLDLQLEASPSMASTMRVEVPLRLQMQHGHQPQGFGVVGAVMGGGGVVGGGLVVMGGGGGGGCRGVLPARPALSAPLGAMMVGAAAPAGEREAAVRVQQCRGSTALRASKPKPKGQQQPPPQQPPQPQPQPQQHAMARERVSDRERRASAAAAQRAHGQRAMSSLQRPAPAQVVYSILRS